MTKPSSPEPLTINRALVGTIAAVMLVGAGILWFFAGSQDMWTGACLKVGLVMAALWLALPGISRRDHWGKASWVSVVGFVAMALILIQRRVDMRLVLAILFGFALAMRFLRPAPKPGRR
jgi:hypothetical protein